MKTIEGVVVNETPFRENSKILNILTKEGIIGVISKGCKNIKSPLRLISSKLTYAEFTIIYNESGLSTLKEGTILNNFTHIRTEPSLIPYSTFVYITDLVKQVIKQCSNETIYNIYISTVKKIEEGLNPIVLMNILEIKMLDYLGCPIELNACVKCGSTKNIITINPDIGGYICSSCHTNEIIYDEKTRKMLRMYYLVDIDSIKELKINDYVIDNINNFLTTYYDRYTGIYIHTKKFLESTLDY
ncbi:MAG: DNA repair protein RecO [Erysipelotrichales bacterium]|nr:DNA repair protein RecO [Erysipelotrichales bacterium]